MDNCRILKLASLCLVGLLFGGAQTAWSTEYFADAVNGNDAYDGLAAVFDGGHGPKRTVQAAVDLAQTGSTAANMNIVTLLPGDYTEGERAVSSGGVVSSNRVVITSPILLRSQNGRTSRDATRIIGAWDTSGAADTKYFMGPRAVRCVWVDKNAKDTRIEGLTFLRGCATWGGDGADHTHATGGGGVVFNAYGNRTGRVIDCAFVACIGTRGGGLYNGTAVRCLFTQCRASKFGMGARQIDAYNCVFADNIRCPGASEGQAALCYSYNVVNCTFVGNEGYGLASANGGFENKVWNCTFQLNTGGSVPASITPNNSATTHTSITANGCAPIIDTEIFSPASGDYRLTDGATSTTVGSADWLAKIPEEFRGTDYYGNPRTNADGTVYAGAVQATAVPKGGRFNISPQANGDYDGSGLLSCNGHVCLQTLYEQGETWPRSVKLGWEPSPGGDGTRGLVRFTINGTSQWPLTNNTAWAVPPKSSSWSVIAQLGDYVYVDPVLGDDAANTGLKGSPFRTLQKAVDGRTGDARAVVLAAPGDYAESATYFLGCSNRVHVTSTAAILVRSVAGSAETFITGAPDTVEPLDTYGWGIGSNAVRCVSVAQGACCAFQGFTLRSGRGSQSIDNKDCDAARGAAFLNGLGTTNYKTGWLLDCVVTNCYGSRGPGAYGGISERTYFTDCGASGLGVLRYAELHSCIVAQNLNSKAGYTLADVSWAYNTTLYWNSNTSAGNSHVYNCVLAGNKKKNVDDLSTVSSRNYRYSVIERFKRNSGTTYDFTGSYVEDPVLNAPDNGDFRLVGGSRASRCGSVSDLRSAMDFTGAPFSFDANGNLRAGALEEMVPGVRIEKSVGGMSSVEIVRVPEEGLSLTDVAAYNGRPFMGFVVNGATQDVSVAQWTVGSAESLAAAPYTIQELFATHFYVDAEGGDDANSGLSEATAWKTLAYASTNATYAGDLVTVLPGTYDEGTVRVPDAISNFGVAKCGSRLAAYPGVTFESRDGAATTIVIGASATGTDGYDVDASTGCGVNAVRCAFVGDGAMIRGFTLRGGRTDYGLGLEVHKKVDLQGIDHMGAGVMGPYSTSSQLDRWVKRVAENCVIDDCVAARGGAARYVTLRNCEISNCGGINKGACLRESRVENCFITQTRSSGSHHFFNLDLSGCTFAADNGNRGVFFDSGISYPAVNTAFCSKTTLGGSVFTNCAFVAGMAFSATGDDLVNVNPVMDVTDFKLDAKGCPQTGSPLIDVGDRSALTDECTTDIAGGQRVYNGQVDIGCFEYDWRTAFARDLGSALTVTTASPDVVQDATPGLAISNGVLAVSWGRKPDGASYEFAAEVTGKGTLTVTLNGEPYATFTAADGVQTRRFTSPVAPNALEFSYTAVEGDMGAALLRDFVHGMGSVLIFR